MLPSEFTLFVSAVNNSPEGGLFIYDMDFSSEIIKRLVIGATAEFLPGVVTLSVRAKRRKPAYDYVDISVKANDLLSACKRMMRLLEVAAE